MTIGFHPAYEDDDPIVGVGMATPAGGEMPESELWPIERLAEAFRNIAIGLAWLIASLALYRLSDCISARLTTL